MILGVDPGLHGALVLLDPVNLAIHRAANLPTFEIKRNGKLKGAVDIQGLARLVEAWKPEITHAFKELVGPMPKQGVSSVWSFCRADCSIETAIACFKIPITPVTPAVWKKAVGAPADKDGARLRASQLMPASTHHWTPERGRITKEDAEGIAEAALIAYYGLQIRGAPQKREEGKILS